MQSDNKLSLKSFTQPNGQLAFKINEACTAVRIGRTSLYEAIKSGQLPARKRGKSTLILAADLRRWLDGLPAVVKNTNV